MRIAVVGTGIAGMVAAHLLHRRHTLTIFEANDYVGGHTHTHELIQDGTRFRVDSGFIVCNDRTYPNFLRLLAELGVATQPTEMSFSVRNDFENLEYNGGSLNLLFSQRRNLLKPRFYRMIHEIIRFNREATLAADSADDSVTLGEFLCQGAFSEFFTRNYVLPMGAAIWSSSNQTMLAFPLRFFASFFRNHGMLNVNDRPQWRVVQGGSQTYVDAIIKPFRDRIHLSSPVSAIHRHSDHVDITTRHGTDSFDAVVIAAHSDQALGMLADPSPVEQRVLSSIGYQANDATIHTDTSLLPNRRRAWAAWNFHHDATSNQRVTMTYNMNILQSLKARRPFCVTLNDSERINVSKEIRRVAYHHPLFTPAAVDAQKRIPEINGQRRTWFCGAYCGYGFHEDGVNSALRVAADLGVDW